MAGLAFAFTPLLYLSRDFMLWEATLLKVTNLILS